MSKSFLPLQGMMSDLLTIDDIAAKVKLRREYVRDKLVKHPNFPRPTFALSQKNRRWSSADVDGWIESQRDSNLR